MSAATEVVDLTISSTEVRSINEVASIITNKIAQYANHYGVSDQFDAARTEEDLLFFLVKRKTLGLEELTCHILEDGEVAVGSFSGRRKASLVFRINYGNARGYV